MKSFLLFLCVAAAEKLDRTYLPPPGSKFSGGVPGDIQTPFETPKDAYSRPNTYKNNAVSPQDTQVEIGINRGVPQKPEYFGDVITSGGPIPSDYYQSTYNLPTTTTSYAFTTTTTHPPQQAYETTIGHINPVTGLPITQFPTSAPSFVNPENYYQGNQQFQQFDPTRKPIYGPTQYFTTSTLPSSQIKEQNQPGFSHVNNLVPTQGPPFTPEVTQGPSITGEDLSRPSFEQSYTNPQFISGSTQRPSYPKTLVSAQGSQYSANEPGIIQENILVPSTLAPATSPSTVQYGGDLDQGINSNVYSGENVPSRPYDNNPIYPGQNPTDYYGSPNQSFVQTGPYVQPGQVQYGTNQGASNFVQYPGAQTDDLRRPAIQSNNIQNPTSTASPKSPFGGQFYSTPGSQPSATTVYPTGSYPTSPINHKLVNQGIQTGSISHPERPQAENDRNAVILNYENVITPDGFSYNFDTSNGIHADESGTALNGVKAKGSYSYIGDDGKLYTVVYTADENGFQPHGDHLPTSPPIPEAIRKVIEQAKQDEEDGISDDGTYDEDKYGHMKYEGEKKQRPSKIPASTPNYFNEKFEDKQTQDGNYPVTYNQKQKVTSDKILPTQPEKLPETSNGEYNYDEDKAGDDKKTLGRPTVRPVSNRKQFGGKFSVQRPDQYIVSENDGFRQEQRNGFEENYPADIKSEQKDNKISHMKKPTASKFRENLDNTQVYEGGYDISDNPTKIPSGYNANKNEEYNNTRTYSNIPKRRPGQASNVERVSSTPGDFQPSYGSRIRPIISTATPVDQSSIYNYQENRRPDNTNRYLSGNGYINQPITSSTISAPTSSLYTGSPIVVMQQDLTGLENLPGQNYEPSSNTGKIKGSNYELQESNKYDLPGSQVPVSIKIDGPSSYNRYSTIEERPQPSTTPIPQENYDYYGSRVTQPGYNRLQNINKAISGRHPGVVSSSTTVSPTKEDEGYQYLPPQRKFELGPKYQQKYENTRPSQNVTYNTKGEVAKPFTTPDSYHDEQDEDIPKNNYYHREDNQYKAQQPGFVRPNLSPTTTAPQTYDNNNNENGPVNYDKIDQQGPFFNGRYENEKDKITTILSTRRPSYQIVTRPQLGQEVSIYDTTKGIPSSSTRPQTYYDRNGNEVTYVPSSPRPSQSTQYEVAQPTTLQPEKKNGNVFITDKTPVVQGFFPTTTVTRPIQKPGILNGRPANNGYEQTPSQSPYQTTYKPVTIVSSGVDSDDTLGTTISPKSPFIGQDYSQVPSTTYRPAFFPSNTVTEKQITVDNFGRPKTRLGNQQEYSQGNPANAGNYRPTGQELQGAVKPTNNEYGRPTTKKVIGENFSGPKQAQKFDPEHGYYY